jgi:hypothetical protein
MLSRHHYPPTDTFHHNLIQIKTFLKLFLRWFDDVCKPETANEPLQLRHFPSAPIFSIFYCNKTTY